MRLLITDDESSARRKVLRFLEGQEDVEVVGEAENGEQALDMVLSHRVDAVYLDIHMPGLDGFGLLRQLPYETRPLVVFATAFDTYAVEAFEANAVDYLLKPFDRARFLASLNRLRTRLANERPVVWHQRIEATLQRLQPESTYAEQFLVPGEDRIQVVHRDHIDWIEAAANYVVLHCGEQRHVLRTSLTALEEKLCPKRFCRVHRQAVVNVTAVVTLEPLFKGDMLLHLKSGAQVRLSRRYRDAFTQRFQR